MFRQILILSFLGCALARAATVELSDGRALKGALVMEGNGFVVLANSVDQNNCVLLRAGDIKKIEADDAETQSARLNASEIGLIDVPPYPSDLLKPARDFTVAQLQSVYGSSSDFNGDETLAKKVMAAEVLVDGIVRSTRDDFRKPWLRDLAESKLPLETVRAIARYGQLPSVEHAPNGFAITSFPVFGATGSDVVITASIPEEYTPDRRWPVVIYLHGTGPGRFFTPKSYPQDVRDRCIVLAPWAKAAHGWGPSTYGRASVWTALEWAASLYSVDFDRVYLEGMSMGGVGSLRNAVIWPDRLAAICPRSGPPLKRNFESMYGNLHHLPMLALSGSADPLIPLDQFKWQKDLMQKLKLPGRAEIFDGRGHDMFNDYDGEVYTFFQQNVRQPFPDHLYFASQEDGANLRQYYVEIVPDNANNSPVEMNILDIMAAQRHEAANGAGNLEQLRANAANIIEKKTAWQFPRIVEMTVDRRKNAINIERAERISSVRIGLDSDLIDMDREVTVTYRGATLARKKPERNIELMLNEARRLQRRDITFWDVIEARLK